ncbi:juvenile hormone epoxide hydrolase-like [Epargyreus clarus]|uniref:juvenile hormone epoxide hydrolase-like n=1 Tax=Epargyreus clarus TaxID=520877 RepID=UPI003C2F9029
MGCAICLAIVAVVGWVAYKLLTGKEKKLPQLDPHEWWGPEHLKGKVDETIRSFEVKFSDEMINDLRSRIKNHRPFTPPLEDVGFQYGFNSSQLDTWLQYWAEEYPFKERETFFNSYPQFKTSIQGLDIHFIRVKPEVPAGVKVVPLLLMHGWPGSVREFFEAIPLLTSQNPVYDFVFEVIIPSLPGYGFSDAAVRPGLGAPKVAVIFKNLMNRLGFKRFYIQGGDWGAAIASAMVTLYPNDILGHHSNMASARTSSTNLWTFIGAYFPSLVVESKLASRMYPLSAFFSFLLEETGYFHIQATKPDTVGVALSDSPAGLLAYILEKFSTWTSKENRDRLDGGLSTFTRVQLIDNLMVYWSTNSITTSMRLYAETFSKPIRDLKLESFTTPVPTWALQAKHEIAYQPPKLLKMKYTNLLGTTELDEGGHFLAFELPSIFAEDVFKAVQAFRNWNMARLLLLAALSIIAFTPIYFLYLRGSPPMPEINLNEWWGPDQMKGRVDASIRPFQVKFSEEMIKDLRSRLKNHRQLVPPLEGVAFEYGFNTKQVDRWVTYWAEEYPFAEREKVFNQFPQFKTNIQGLDIHFIRVKPKVASGKEVVPLLLLHGWPGSTREFLEAIPLLTAVSKDRDFAVEVIVPSLPGYGFSDAAVKPGLGADKMAVVFRNLMNRLGFKKYYVQGGDWGSLIASTMATFFPKEVLGYHANVVFLQTPAISFFTILGSIYPPLVVKSDVADRMYPLSKIFCNILEEMGYMHIQATKPDTVGVSLTDSPVGLAVYILEKFSTWTRMDHRSVADGGLAYRFSKEQLVDNLMMYWVPNAITTSVRLYSETLNKRFYSMQIDEIKTYVPTWVIQAKHDLTYLPPWLARLKYPNLIHETVLQDGGHFLAFELPKVFSEDVLQAITAFRVWHKENSVRADL